MHSDPSDNSTRAAAAAQRATNDAGRGPAAPAVAVLARAFADEPELIQALLEAPETPQDTTAVVLAAAQAAARQRPDYADLHYQVALAAARKRRWRLAARAVQQALRRNERYAAALILAADVARAQQHTDEALHYLDRALTAGADYPDVHLRRGDLHAAAGHVAQARGAYERALALQPDLPAARRRLARLPVDGSGKEQS